METTTRQVAQADMDKLAYCLKKAARYLNDYEYLEEAEAIESVLALIEDAQDILAEEPVAV